MTHEETARYALDQIATLTAQNAELADALRALTDAAAVYSGSAISMASPRVKKITLSTALLNARVALDKVGV